MATLNVTTLDVWGNSTDGYEVNDKFYSSYNATVHDGDSDEYIVQQLQDIEWLESHVKAADLTFEGDVESGIFITVTETGYPLTHLLPRQK